MLRPSEQEVRNYSKDLPSLRDAGRQIADASKIVGNYAMRNRKMIGWAATTGVFLGLSIQVGDNLGLGSANKMGNNFVNLVTYVGSVVGIGISSVKARSCIDNMCLERRSC